MFIIHSYGLAVLFCLITMVCWGSWANTQKLAARTWRFELFYWDYVLGIGLLALVLALTLGSTGDAGRSFGPDVRQASATSLGSALLGGVLFNAANILLGAAIAIAGMSVAFPVGIGLALIVGVIVNYINLPVGNPALLFGGVLLVGAAIGLNAFAYRRVTTVPAGTPERDRPGESTRGESTGTRGLVLSVVAGVLMGFFYRFVAASMFPNFDQPEPGKLSPYTAVVFFAIGVFLSNFLFNTALMYRPFVGTPVSYADYFRGSARNHLTGMLGGTIWCLGMAFSILASGKAGPAISYGLGQGATVVAAIWGIYIWREFRNASAGTYRLLNVMLLCYVAGLGLLIMAR